MPNRCKNIVNCSKRKVVEANCSKNKGVEANFCKNIVNSSKRKVVEANCNNNMANCSKNIVHSRTRMK